MIPSFTLYFKFNISLIFLSSKLNISKLFIQLVNNVLIRYIYLYRYESHLLLFLIFNKFE